MHRHISGYFSKGMHSAKHSRMFAAAAVVLISALTLCCGSGGSRSDTSSVSKMSAVERHVNGLKKHLPYKNHNGFEMTTAEIKDSTLNVSFMVSELNYRILSEAGRHVSDSEVMETMLYLSLDTATVNLMYESGTALCATYTDKTNFKHTLQIKVSAEKIRNIRKAHKKNVYPLSFVKYNMLAWKAQNITLPLAIDGVNEAYITDIIFSDDRITGEIEIKDTAPENIEALNSYFDSFAYECVVYLKDASCYGFSLADETFTFVCKDENDEQLLFKEVKMSDITTL